MGYNTVTTAKTGLRSIHYKGHEYIEFKTYKYKLCTAATKIQANFRGHMARKQGKTEDEMAKEMEKTETKQEEEELDIDLTDPELHKAATKIQASFRGHKVRKDDKPEDGQ